MSAVTLLITSSTAAVAAEKRYSKSTTVGQLKGKLELVVGIPAASQKLVLKDASGNAIATLDNDDAMLGAYPIDGPTALHVINTDPTAKAGEFDDVSGVDKFELTDEQYEGRQHTVLAYKKRNKMGRFNPELTAQMEEEKAKQLEADQKLLDGMKIGDRCEVTMTKTGTKHRGTVKYTGGTDFKEGLWVGVQLDEPYGKNDGSVQGKRYFECDDNYGVFAKPSNVLVGDFPEEDLGLSSDDEI